MRATEQQEPAAQHCRVAGANGLWLQWQSDDKVSARLQRVKQRWCSQCSSTSATSRSCETREGLGRGELVAMPLSVCETEASDSVAKSHGPIIEEAYQGTRSRQISRPDDVASSKRVLLANVQLARVASSLRDSRSPCLV